MLRRGQAGAGTQRHNTPGARWLAGPIAREAVTFTSEGLQLAGDLRIPYDRAHGAPAGLPALVFTGPLSGVKDQVVGNYAERLVGAGFVTLAFDHRNFGGSEGERQHEDPAGKIADLRDAVGYLSSRPRSTPTASGSSVSASAAAMPSARPRSTRACVRWPASAARTTTRSGCVRVSGPTCCASGSRWWSRISRRSARAAS
jgi:hypothetical protein